jgi:hypothetical protein
MIGSSDPALDEAIRASALDRQIRQAREAGAIFEERRLRAERAELSPPPETWLENDLAIGMRADRPIDPFAALTRRF